MSLTADIDGTDITSICQSIKWRKNLSRPSTGIVRFPGHLFSVSTGQSELHIYNSGSLVFSGLCAFPQADGGPDSAYTEVTAYDHLVCLIKRLCKDGDNLITPGDVILNEGTAPAILAAYINNAITDSDALTPPSAPLPLSVGSVASGGDDVSGVPTNFPMTIDEMRILLISTGQLDVIVNPGFGSSSLALTNGDAGSDLSGSVSFEYGTGAHNAQIGQLTEDMEDVINALWYLLGPRIDEEHWKGSITPTAPHKHPHPASPNPLHQHTWPAGLVSRFNGSRQTYGYMQEVRVFDDKDDENSIRPLFEEEWANEAWIRATPRQFATVRPQRGTPLAFDVGDLIHVAAGSMLNGGFSGNQRVYQFEIECDTDGVKEVTEILTSSDQEGA